MTMGFVSIRLVCLYCVGFDTVALDGRLQVTKKSRAISTCSGHEGS